MARRSASTEAKCSIHNSSVAGSPTLPFPPLVPQICHLGCNFFGLNKPSHRALSAPRRVGLIRPPATRPSVAQSCCSAFVPIFTGTSDWYGDQSFRGGTYDRSRLVSFSPNDRISAPVATVFARHHSTGRCKHSWSLQYALDWLLDKMISHCR